MDQRIKILVGLMLALGACSANQLPSQQQNQQPQSAGTFAQKQERIDERYEHIGSTEKPIFKGRPCLLSARRRSELIGLARTVVEEQADLLDFDGRENVSVKRLQRVSTYSRSGGMLEHTDEVLKKKWVSSGVGENSISSETGVQFILGSAGEGITFYCDSSGNSLHTAMYGKDNLVREHWEFVLDERGNRIETVFYNRNGQLTARTMYQYRAFDSLGNWTERRRVGINYLPDRVWETKSIEYRTISYY